MHINMRRYDHQDSLMLRQAHSDVRRTWDPAGNRAPGRQQLQGQSSRGHGVEDAAIRRAHLISRGFDVVCMHMSMVDYVALRS